MASEPGSWAPPPRPTGTTDTMFTNTLPGGRNMPYGSLGAQLLDALMIQRTLPGRVGYEDKRYDFAKSAPNWPGGGYPLPGRPGPGNPPGGGGGYQPPPSLPPSGSDGRLPRQPGGGPGGVGGVANGGGTGASYSGPWIGAGGPFNNYTPAGGTAKGIDPSAWMNQLMSGQDTYGGTNQSRADWATANNAGADLNNGMSLFDAMRGAPITTDWQSMIKTMSGQPNGNPIELMRDLQAKAGLHQNWANVQRSLTNSGLDSTTSTDLLEAFGGSGSGAYDAAKRLGILDAFNQAGGMTFRRPQQNGLLGPQGGT